MKHLKTTAEAEKTWQEIVFKMREAEGKSSRNKELQERIDAILDDKEIVITLPPKTKKQTKNF